MYVRSDVALKALEMMAACARVAVDYMGICHPKPEDKMFSLEIVNTTEELTKAALTVADDEYRLEPIEDPKPMDVKILYIEPRL